MSAKASDFVQSGVPIYILFGFRIADEMFRQGYPWQNVTLSIWETENEVKSHHGN